MAVYVPDSSAVIDILRGKETVLRRLTEALEQNAQFLLCPIVYYEVSRGLMYAKAERQLTAFRELRKGFKYERLVHQDWAEAVQRWVTLRQNGFQVGDADLLIGVFAGRRDAVVITSNTRHFGPMHVEAEDWRLP